MILLSTASSAHGRYGGVDVALALPRSMIPNRLPTAGSAGEAVYPQRAEVAVAAVSFSAIRSLDSRCRTPEPST
jgi:hypothetical protein